MSIPAQVLTPPTTMPTTAPTAVAEGGVVELLVLGPLAVIAVILAVRVGAFRRGTIVGPPRVSDDESLGLLLLGFAAGFMMWIATQVLILSPTASTPPVEPATTSTAATSTAVVTTRPRVPEAAEVSPGRVALASSVPALVAAALVVMMNVSMRRDGLRKLGASASHLRRGVSSGLIGSAIMVPLVFVVGLLTELLWQALRYAHPKEHDLLRLMKEASGSGETWVPVVLVISAVILAPLWEELLFRGHLQTLITHALARLLGERRTRGFDVVVTGGAPILGGDAAQPQAAPAEWMRWASVIMTSLLFSIVHPAWSIPPIFFLSVCLGYAYERTGNLWTVIVMHAVFNTSSTVLFLTFAK